MFRITNSQTRQQETYATRDDLLSFINEKSVWSEDRAETLTLRLEQLAEDDTILDSMTLHLPLQEIVEEALSQFGLKRDKKGFPFINVMKPQKPVQAQEKTTEPEQEVREALSAPLEAEKPQKQPSLKESKGKPAKQQPKGRTFGSQLIWLALVTTLSLVSFILAVVSYTNTHSQSKEIKRLENRIILQEKQGEIEVAGRNFISNYYSGDSRKLDSFLSKDLKAEGVEAKTGVRVQSIIFESIEESKEVISISFVVTTKKEEEDSYKRARLTLSFQPDQKSIYGYVLDKQPKFSSFGE